MKRVVEIASEQDVKGVLLNLVGIAVAMFRVGSTHLTLVLSDKKRSNPQNDHFHGQIDDIFVAMKSVGSKRSFNWWKRALSEQFIAENPDLDWEDSGVTPSLDGQRILQIFVPTSEFSVKQSRAFTEWLYAYGSERGVLFRVDRRLQAQAA